LIRGWIPVRVKKTRQNRHALFRGHGDMPFPDAKDACPDVGVSSYLPEGRPFRAADVLRAG
jgi:hypothetical protein